jgi:CheY-like chemotaxis protein
MGGDSRLLILDDEEATRRILRRRLEAEGYEVVEAPDGRGAVETVKREGIDLVITDILMPEREGLETVRALHAAYPALHIFAMAGIPEAHYLAMARAFGASRMFVKPVDVELLVGAVRDTLARRGP